MTKLISLISSRLRERSSLNLITSIAYRVISTTLGIVLPSLFIMTFGSQTNGLLSSVSQFFTYLGLLEAGVATTALQALYLPIKNDNHDEVNGIMAATYRYHVRTGIIYSILLFGLSVVYPCIVDTGLPFIDVVVIILLNGTGSLCNYFFTLKYTVYIRAEGKIYILNILYTIGAVLRSGGKIVAIYLGYDVIAVQLVTTVVAILEAFLIRAYVYKSCPWMNIKTTPQYEKLNQRKSVMLQSIVFLVFNHTDILILTFVLNDLKLVSVYSVYLLIFDAVQNLVDGFSDSYQYKIGRLSQDQEALRAYYSKYEKLYCFFCMSLSLTAYLLTKPFLTLYVGKATDVDYLVKFLPELFFALQVLKTFRSLERQLINATGHFKKTEKIGIIEMIINLSSSIVLVFIMGINGVVIGTIIGLLYSSVAYSLYNNKSILGTSRLRGYGYAGLLLMVMAVASYVGYRIVPIVESYFKLVLIAIPVFSAAVLLFGGITAIALFAKKKRYV